MNEQALSPQDIVALKEEIRSSMHCALPGVVESFDADTQTVSVRPMLKQKKALPMIRNVPVFFPGTRESAVTWQISTGDECLLVFADMDIDRWFETGEAEEPASGRRHDLADAFAFVGFRSSPGVLQDISGDPSFFGMTEAGIDAKFSSVDTKIAGKADTGHKHSAADITSGTLPIARGGTGATSAANARTALDVPSNAVAVKASGTTYSTPGLTLDGNALIPHVTSYFTCAKNTEVAIGKLRNGAVIIVVSDTYGADVFIKSSSVNFFGDIAPLKNNIVLHALEHNVSVENKSSVTVGITVIA